MKQKSNHPAALVALPGIPIPKMVIRSLFLLLVLLLVRNMATAKIFRPTCPTITVEFSLNPSPACVGNVLTLNATPSGGTAPYTYSWSGPNSFTATTSTGIANTPPFTITDDGGQYSVTVEDANGCSSGPNFANVSLFSNPSLSVVATPNPVCLGNTLSLTSGFSSGGSGITTYSWTGPNGYTATDENATRTNVASTDCIIPVVIFLSAHLLPVFSFDDIPMLSYSLPK